MTARSFRPAWADDLGMRRALSDRLLPLLVGAMVFLAALALSGAIAAAGLAAHWRTGAAALMTVTVPQMSQTSAGAAARILSSSPAVASARQLTPAEIGLLLKPWLGEDPSALSLRLPAMFEVRLTDAARDPGLAQRLDQAAPGTLVERNGAWLTRLADLVRSMQACAAIVLIVVTIVAAAVVAVATRAGLAARRDAIDIVHGLGAADGLIAAQFANRITVLVLAGAVLGLLLALPLLLSLARLAAPFDQASSPPPAHAAIVGLLPPLLWGLLAMLPAAAALIGWLTTQATVRGWLRRLP